jgi:ribosome-interacting GTPase 1
MIPAKQAAAHPTLTHMLDMIARNDLSFQVISLPPIIENIDN